MRIMLTSLVMLLIPTLSQAQSPPAVQPPGLKKARLKADGTLQVESVTYRSEERTATKTVKKVVGDKVITAQVPYSYTVWVPVRTLKLHAKESYKITGQDGKALSVEQREKLENALAPVLVIPMGTSRQFGMWRPYFRPELPLIQLPRRKPQGKKPDDVRGRT